jgi:DNA-binding LacI/PurR family transcriptional regulator
MAGVVSDTSSYTSRHSARRRQLLLKPPRSDDVARLAGVSRATVSAVVNGNKYVSDDLRVRVEQAIAQLGYRPHGIARSLKSSRTATIGLVIPSIESHFWAPVVRGAEAVFAEAGYRLVLANTDEEGARAEAALEGLLEHQVDGVLIAPPAGSKRRHYEAYLASGRPLVFIERTVPGVEADYVGVDGRAGGQAAAAHLLNLGRRRLAILTLPLDVSASRERVQGVRSALQAVHLTLSDDQIVVGLSEREGFAAAQGLLQREPRPDALIVAGLRMTIGAFAAVREANLRIPDDIALIGYDETPWASLLTPPLTVVRQPARDLGRLGAEILLRRLQGEVEEWPQSIVLQPELLVRGSCGRKEGG